MLNGVVVLSKDDFAELVDLRISVKSDLEEFRRKTLNVAWTKWELRFGATLEKVDRILKEVITPKPRS